MLRIFTAYRGISRVRLTRFEQRWYEDESSSVHRETVAFTMRVKPGLFGKQPRQQRRQQQSYVHTFENKVQLQKRKGSFERTELGLWFLDDIRGEDIIWDSHLQECLLRHHKRRHSEEARATYWDIILPVLRTVECTRIPKLIGKRIHVWGLIALLLPQKLQICKLGNIRAIRRP